MKNKGKNMRWGKRWMELATLISTWSKDRSRKTAAVIVDHRNVVLSVGWNGFPRGVNDNINKRHKRPDKYKWTEHAERNAIYNAAAKGIPLQDSTMYLAWYPCCDCARAIIQSGISKLICVEPDWSDPHYAEDFDITRKMLNETNIQVFFNPEFTAPTFKENV